MYLHCIMDVSPACFKLTISPKSAHVNLAYHYLVMAKVLQTSDQLHFKLINRCLKNKTSQNIITLIKGRESNNLREYCKGQININDSLNYISYYRSNT